MTQWQELQNIDAALQNQVIQLYDDQKFPLDLRRILCNWIEDQNWELVALDESQARDVFNKLLHQVEVWYSHLAQQNNLLGGPNYLELGNNVKALFESNPVNMALIISRCLSEERRIITSARMNLQVSDHNAAMKSQTLLDNYIIELKRNIQMADLDIKSIGEQLWKHDFCLKEWQDEDEEDKHRQSARSSDSNQTGKHTSVLLYYSDVCHLIGNTVNLAELVVSTVVDEELKSWKLRQQQACIGAPLDTSLHKLQTWFMAAAKYLNLQLQQLRKLQELDQQSPPNDFLCSLRIQCEETTQCLFTKLLKNALVVEKQPVSSAQRPLILKTGVRFAVSTRFLVNLSSFNWMPKVTLIFDNFRKFNFTTKGVSKLLDAEETGLVAQFERLALAEEKYKSNRQNASPLAVTEELHFITCVMELELTGMKFDIEISTLPLVVISSTNQSHGAWASILWSAMVVDHQPKNLLFLTPPPVTWQQLSEVLSWQFQAMSERGLDDLQLAMLRDKFVDDHDSLVTWNKFYKCDGTWVWIEGILDLIKKHLLPIWRDGHIMGFISRESAIVLLQDKPTGTFLLRFSESIKEGAITFSWVDRSKGAAHVHAVEPYKKELAISSLADILRNYHLQDTSSKSVNPLLYLYPDIPKDHAFQHYYSKPVEKANGYLPRNPGHWSVNPTPPPSPEENKYTSMDHMDISTSTMEELFPGLSDMGGPLDQVASPFNNDLQADGGWTDQYDLS
ncbi:unnamed protein product [Lota lota]